MINFHQSPITYVSDVHLKVADLERSLAFYEHVIGFRVLNQSRELAVLTADGITPLVTIEQPPGVQPKKQRTTGLYHFAILLPSRQQLGSFLQHTMELHLRVGSADHAVSEAIYLDDPDHNGIEIYADRSPNEWTWQEDVLQMTVDPLQSADLLAQTQGKAWQGLPSGTKMGHIHLHVASIPEAERFYAQGLGLQVMLRYGSQAIFVASGGYHHHLGLNTWQGVGAPAPDSSQVGLKHFTLKLTDEHTRHQVIAQLAKIGADVQLVEGQFVVEDPSGNRIQLSV